LNTKSKSKNKKKQIFTGIVLKNNGKQNIAEIDRINGFEALGSQFSLITC